MILLRDIIPVSTHRTLWTKKLQFPVDELIGNPEMPDFSVGKIMKTWGNEMHCSVVVGHFAGSTFKKKCA